MMARCIPRFDDIYKPVVSVAGSIPADTDICFGSGILFETSIAVGEIHGGCVGKVIAMDNRLVHVMCKVYIHNGSGQYLQRTLDSFPGEK